MGNDPELSGKYLGTITTDFAIVSDTLKEASYQIRIRKFSEHPIFVVSKTETHIGKLLIHKEELALQWNFYASYLDEFVQRRMVDKASDFIETYKDPDEFCCLFVVDKGFANFIFIPYPED